MTRTEYLTQLELYLKKLPEADRIEAMDYFRELFDDAGVEGEEELMITTEFELTGREREEVFLLMERNL
ncbi:hypothetical protein OLG96_09455, partial [Streptococcus pneumoniae]|nr:hypothetical protein [Streptococcus pneumoniae]MDG9592528.1 hypothetical protein [Streptococcus pneumoniae]